MVWRNLAFYRYPDYVDKSQRLRDLGFEIVPPLPEGKHWIGDIPMWTLSATMTCMGFFAFFGNVDGRVKPHFFNMATRFSEMLAIGHTLRFCTYIGTTLPGSADHCFGDFRGMDPPKPTTLREVFFTRFALAPGNNCGDLAYSGHIFQCFLEILIIFKYSKACLRLPPILHTMLLVIVTCCAIIQVPILLSARNHYTVDVVIALYVTPLLWFWHSTYWKPNDLCPGTIGVEYDGQEPAKSSGIEMRTR